MRGPIRYLVDCSGAGELVKALRRIGRRAMALPRPVSETLPELIVDGPKLGFRLS